MKVRGQLKDPVTSWRTRASPMPCRARSVPGSQYHSRCDGEVKNPCREAKRGRSVSIQSLNRLSYTGSHMYRNKYILVRYPFLHWTMVNSYINDWTEFHSSPCFSGCSAIGYSDPFLYSPSFYVRKRIFFIPCVCAWLILRTKVTSRCKYLWKFNLWSFWWWLRFFFRMRLTFLRRNCFFFNFSTPCI